MFAEAACILAFCRAGFKLKFGWLADRSKGYRIQFPVGGEAAPHYRRENLMASTELFLISVLRALVEVAGYTLIGQGILALFAGKNRDSNFVYRLMRVITDPPVKLVRWITPRIIIDKHIPFVTFFLLFWLWIGLAVAKRYVCAAQGLAC